ncbi:hypothetical protein AV274_1749 [Blastocystis sp. ATCC 50177/Nand II]|uniref:Transmembrane protein n=2 Tax=Blastocystis sp. subtype 1 (strain ATCC 50177 / NandII) TaxID=478820 RepID=A0A196SKX8_BLAHN|nr:hypothetical protein AV274_1749 [Blastocystis sp. ATCC 50177/Nand II]
MSDWRSVRNRQHKGAKEEEENQFVFEDTSVDDDDDDVEVVKAESTEVDKPKTKEVSISPERKEELEKKAKRIAGMKRALRFGASAGCMLGGMLGVYDSTRSEGGAKVTMTTIMKRMPKSLAFGLLSMGGFFTLYQVTKTGLMYYRQSFDYYNHFAAFAIGALPFMKMPFMRHYFFYPILLVGFDVFGDYRSMHGQDKTAF